MMPRMTGLTMALRWGLLAVLLACPGLFTGCNDGGGGGNDAKKEAAEDGSGGDGNGAKDETDNGDDDASRDIGDNNPNLLVAIGDSITAGSEVTGPSYPQRLSSILGKPVQNRGVGGATSAAAPGQAAGALAQKPAYLLIMFGTNDVFTEVPPSVVAGNLAAAVRLARAQRTIPVVATIPPNLRSEFLNGFARSVNSAIKSMARREGALLADVEAEFGSGEALIQADGYHPNETGTQVIAFTFADAIR